MNEVPMEEMAAPQPGMPGALVQPAPSFMDLRDMGDGSLVLYINSVNGAFWFPLDPKQVKPFFENAVAMCTKASSGLIVPPSAGSGIRL